MIEKQNTKKIELLAPAGSYETFRAVIRAGADAVYLGGSHFGARAYADNFNETELLSAIDYAHMHGRQVYLTVNTLFKEKELNEELYRYLLPYYKQGLDAVIVQDMGVFSFIRQMFPNLDIHTSTQMTVTGRYGAAYMKELGASRVVTAREMSFAEIRDIYENVEVEIESFVHGALCYCYSGQCLLSSMLGGRSGNRGRCAQPCRLPYEVYDENLKQISTNGNYILSPKDLCTISAIPQLVESGVYSFKIEGRMKQAEYAAGVVSIYRSYIDRYLEELKCQISQGKSEKDAYLAARKAYRVSKEDMQKLLDFGNRSGFTDGYYFRQNGREMITLKTPGHARTNEALQSEIREKYVQASAPGTEIKEKINGILKLIQDFPATIELNYRDIHTKYEGDMVHAALKQPLSREKVEASIRKTGNTPFEFEQLDIKMDEAVFLPVQALNQLRRVALEQLQEQIVAKWRRELPVETGKTVTQEQRTETHVHEKKEYVFSGCEKENLAVSVERQNQLAPVLKQEFVDDIYLDSSCYKRDDLFQLIREDIKAIHAAGKKSYYILPAIFRHKTAEFYLEHIKEFLQVGLDGVVVKSFDSASFAKEQLVGKMDIILDHNLYSWNHRAKDMLEDFMPLRDTVPLELNRKELFVRNNAGSEMILYGYLPLMISAQCVHANAGKCDKYPTVTYLKDRYGKFFPVKNNCTECYNSIYNTTPLLLFDFHEDFKRMGMGGYRISLTTENAGEVLRIMELYQEVFLSGKTTIKDQLSNGTYTNGHYKRGVE